MAIDSTGYQVRVSLREGHGIAAQHMVAVDRWLADVGRVVSRVFNNQLRREREGMHLPKRLRRRSSEFIAVSPPNRAPAVFLRA